jgi:hypothetical protein
VSALLFSLVCAPQGAAAWWEPDKVALDAQISKADAIGLIHVEDEISFGEGDDVWTTVGFVFLDKEGKKLSEPHHLTYAGGETEEGFVVSSISPSLEVDSYYIVFLVLQPDSSYQLLDGQMSVLPVFPIGDNVSPAAIVTLSEFHGLTDSLDKSPITIVSLGDVLDFVSSLAPIADGLE